MTGLGDQFLDEFVVAMQLLESDPKRERLYYRNFRRVIFRRFPYKVFYQVFETRVVVCFAFFMVSRNTVWKNPDLGRAVSVVRRTIRTGISSLDRSRTSPADRPLSVSCVDTTFDCKDSDMRSNPGDFHVLPT
jgi:hypothetical protein